MNTVVLIMGVLNVVWMFGGSVFVYLCYVRPAQRAKERGRALEDTLREERGNLDLVVLATPAWRVFVRMASGAPLEACVEDSAVPFETLVERAKRALEGATASPGPRERQRELVKAMLVKGVQTGQIPLHGEEEGTWTLDS